MKTKSAKKAAAVAKMLHTREVNKQKKMAEMNPNLKPPLRITPAESVLDNIPRSLLRTVKQEEAMKKSAIEEAKDIIYNDREKTYGRPDKNLNTIANLWETYLHSRGLFNENSHGLTATDVAIMQVLLKIARHGNMYKRDNIVDGIGYLALVDRIREELGQP